MIESTNMLDPVKRASSGIVLLFATTLFLSSLLMFALEPIVAKTVLPILGGTPMVWNTCVLFFQVLLLGGTRLRTASRPGWERAARAPPTVSCCCSRS